MAKGRPDDRDVAAFFPRITVSLLAVAVIFSILAVLYVLPVLLEPPPPGAIPDYVEERVKARLSGKVLWLFVASFLTATALSLRGLLPGSKRRT